MRLLAFSTIATYEENDRISYTPAASEHHMTSHKNILEQCISDKGNLKEAVRKAYLSYPTHALVGESDIEFDIRNKIKLHFNVGIHCVQFAGSAKTGYSFHQSREFIRGESDLDVAIISESLYLRYSEIMSLVTKDFTDLSCFGRTQKGVSHEVLMKDSMFKFGMILFDIFPSCTQKNLVMKLCRDLTLQYSEIFKKISIAIYSSTYFFESKQATSLSISS